MCRLLRYCVSHSLYAAMTRLEEINKGVSLWMSIRYLGYLSTLNLLVAVCLGLYVRWERTAQPVLLVIFILGLFVLGMASIFYYYFSMERVSLCLFHLWLGFLLGLLCFLNVSSLDMDLKEQITCYMLVASVLIRTLWALVERVCGCTRHRPALLKSAEALELTGFAVASTTQVAQDSMSLAVLALAVATLVTDLRMKSFLVTLWGFHSKLSDCQRACVVHRTELGALDRVMASRGMRHFCLISKRLVFLSLLSTVIFGALSWQPSNSLFISVFLLVLPLESLAHGFFYELGNCLGGTSVGYAVVIPTNYCSPDGQPTLLPPDQVQELNLRSTGMLNSVQRFFSHHMIETHGCDYSTSGLMLSTIQAKLRSFLEAHTADGPRFDTYVLFYSGHTHRTGEWALAGGDVLRLDEIVQLWREKNAGYCSRLILILDTENSLPWVKEVRRVKDTYVAVQGATLSNSVDLEIQNAPQLGDFTSQWVDFNCNPDSCVRWAERGRTVMAMYGLSRHWGDYKLHLPTGNDVAKHWKMYFPRLTYPVVQLVHWCSALNLFLLCGICLRFLRRFKLNWFPPAVLDTGQGFKLVRS